MQQFWKHKTFIILFSIALAATVISTTIAVTGTRDPVRGAINTLMTPLQKGMNYIANALSGYAAYFTQFDAIVAENARLREENAALAEKLYEVEDAVLQNEWLYSFLEMKRTHTDFTMEEAVITGRSAGNYLTVFTVDCGTADGVAEGMPAVTKDGVVGYVSEVGQSWAKVYTLMDTSTAVGAYVEQTGELGLIKGSFSLASKGLCQLVYLDGSTEIKVGDRILTSGYGSVYPRDLVVGFVTAVEPDGYSRTMTATIAPAVDLSALDRVMIITSFEVSLNE